MAYDIDVKTTAGGQEQSHPTMISIQKHYQQAPILKQELAGCACILFDKVSIRRAFGQRNGLFAFLGQEYKSQEPIDTD